MRLKTDGTKQRKSIRLYAEKLREIKQLAKKNNLTQQQIFERGIDLYLAKLKKEA